MKKLYTLILAAATATSVFAVAPGQIDLSKLENLRPISGFTSSDEPVYIDMSNVQDARHLTPATFRTPAKAPLAVEAVMGDYDMTLTPLNTGVATQSNATLEYLSQYEVIEFNFDEISSLYPFEGTYDEATASLSFKALNYGQLSASAYLFMIPVTSDKKYVTSGSITVPYDETTKTFDFQGYGLAFVSVSPTGSIGNAYWAGTNFSLKAADPTMALKLEAGEETNPENKFTFKVNAGSGITSIKALLLADSDDKASDYAAYYPVYGQDIKANTEYTITPKMDKTGPFCVCVAGYDAEGNIVKTDQTTFIVIVDEKDAYTTIGTFEFVDPFISVLYSNSDFTNPACEIQEKTDEPGKFRLVNPYAGHKALVDNGCNYYIYLDITDPEFASMEYSPTGVNYGEGIIILGSCAALGYDKETALQRNMAIGVLDGRAILWPIKALFSHELKFNDPGSWTYLNSKAPVEFNLPDLTLEVKALDLSGAPAEGIAIEVAGATGTTDAEGIAKLTLPAEVDYLATVTVKASKDDAAAEKEVKLTGITNQCDITIDTSAVKNIAADADAPAEYYNLQGVRIDNPAAGQIVIKCQGGHAAKILVK